jgi:hypothetical protein
VGDNSANGIWQRATFALELAGMILGAFSASLCQFKANFMELSSACLLKYVLRAFL